LRGADTAAQPAAGGGLLAQVLSAWPGLGHRALHDRHGAGSEGSPVAYVGKVDGASTKGVRGTHRRGEVCHGSPRRSGVDEAAESGMGGGVSAIMDGSRGWRRSGVVPVGQ
jgi:hypothetical protein